MFFRLLQGAALAISVSSGVKAQSAPGNGVAKAGLQHHHHHWQPRKHTDGKRMRAHTGAHCQDKETAPARE
jgi:hypothetical protein